MFRRHFCVAILCLWCSSLNAQTIPAPLKEQADALARLIYLDAEIKDARRYYLYQLDPETEYAIVLFMFEPGNRYENWMAVFQTAEQPYRDTPKAGRFTLAAFQVVGRKSWRAVEFSRPLFSYNARDMEATITLKTTENAKGDAPNFPSKPGRAIYKLKSTWREITLSEITAKP